MDREFSQPELIGGILLWLDEHGVKEMNARQINAVIAAADSIIAEIDRPHAPAVPSMGLAAWLASDDTGISSRYLLSVLAPRAGLGSHPYSPGSSEPWPHDGSDFGRCVRLLDAVPEMRPHVSALAGPEHGAVWNAIAANWPQLEAWYREDLAAGEGDRVGDWIEAVEKELATIRGAK